MEFRGNVLIGYRLKLITGLHIGGMKSSFEIGSLDNPVVKLPGGVNFKFISFIDGEEKEVKPEAPYIPGSSLKGKVRSLVEWKYASDVIPDNKSWKVVYKNYEIYKLFGITPEEFKKLNEKLKSSENGGNGLNPEEIFPVRGRFFDLYIVDGFEETEVKAENSVDRLTAKANPRFMERVPPGTVFEGLIIIRLFRPEDAELLSLLKEGFSLLEDDYLGGCGSRGYGRVKVEKVRIVYRPKGYYTTGEGEETIGDSEKKLPLEAFDKAKEKLEELLRTASNNSGTGEDETEK